MPDDDVAQPTQVDPRLGLGVVLIGTDGSTWDLYEGPVRVLAGASGFGTPTPEHRWRDSPLIDGSSWQGMRTPPKTATLPVYIHEPTSLDWRDTDVAFFDALDPAKVARLVVTTPDAGSRWLGLRYVDGGDVEYDVDPLLLRYGAYVLKLMAEDPYWMGAPVETRFTVAAQQPLFPGPPFNINPSTLLQTATVTNPGDVATSPRWKVTDPFTAFRVGVGDATVVYSSGSTSTHPGGGVEIDMDPRRLTIRNLDGTDAWDQVTVADFADVPPGLDVPLNLDLSGAAAGTTIQLAITPRYRRAW